jgi:hypothetical protein
MGVLAAVVGAAREYPALAPLALLASALALWAYRRRRWVLMAGAVILGGGTTLLYTGGLQAAALSRFTATPASLLAGPLPEPARATIPRAPGDRGYFSSTRRLHPRFPRDLPLPPTFRIEHATGGISSGSVSVRFRFRGDGADAVRNLRETGQRNGWEVEVKAPHRLVLRKGGRSVEAWFSYPAHSGVLDVLDER